MTDEGYAWRRNATDCAADYSFATCLRLQQSSNSNSNSVGTIAQLSSITNSYAANATCDWVIGQIGSAASNALPITINPQNSGASGTLTVYAVTESVTAASQRSTPGQLLISLTTYDDTTVLKVRLMDASFAIALASVHIRALEHNCHFQLSCVAPTVTYYRSLLAASCDSRHLTIRALVAI